MYHRHAIRDEDWDRIKDLLPGKATDPGVTAKGNRLFIDAVLWVAKTGAPWRDLPERFGNSNSARKRFDRWARKGRWQETFQHFQDEDLEWLVLDSTVVRAHPHAAGAKKKATARAGKRSRRWARAGADGGRRSTRRSAP